MKHFKAYKAEIFCIWIFLVCFIPNVALCITEHYPAYATLTNLILPAGVYLWLSASSQKIGRTGLWMFILMFFAAFQIVLLFLFGRSVIAVDMFLNLVTTNPGEVSELLGNMLPVIALVAVLYLPTLIISIVAVRKHWRLKAKFGRGVRKVSLGIISLGVVSLILSYFNVPNYSILDYLYPVNVADNIYLAVDRTVKIGKYHDTSANFSYHAKATPRTDAGREIYVIVVGETSRACQWHKFGYHKATSAPIDTLKGLYSFDKAVSESNTTHKSVPLLLSSLTASNFEDSIYTHKGIATAFKEAGFHTVYASNQLRNHSFIDFFGEECDTTVFINDNHGETDPHCFDHELLSFIDAAIADTVHPRQLIILHTYGSHFCYSDRYPATGEPFSPDSPINVASSNTTNLVNAYDNSIHYTASMLKSLADKLAEANVCGGFIYTSDHGEDIFDDSRRLFLHASPVPSYYQLHVPMFIWLTDAYAQAHGESLAALSENQTKVLSPSISLFHSALQMAGITTPYFDESLSLLSNSYKERELMYLNDHNRGVPLTESGITNLDINQFAGAKIAVKK